MGIRYYAYAVPSEFAELAAIAPRDFIGVDPLYDAWGPTEDRPPMLYLDKCWRELQVILGGAPNDQPRISYELVRGEVTMHSNGWDAFVRYLTHESVREIAHDLAGVDSCQVMEALTAIPVRPHETFVAQVNYAQHYLDAALQFTSELSKKGEGLAYLIG